jgi:hypothetical protein
MQSWSYLCSTNTTTSLSWKPSWTCLGSTNRTTSFPQRHYEDIQPCLQFPLSYMLYCGISAYVRLRYEWYLVKFARSYDNLNWFQDLLTLVHPSLGTAFKTLHHITSHLHTYQQILQRRHVNHNSLLPKPYSQPTHPQKRYNSMFCVIIECLQY